MGKLNLEAFNHAPKKTTRPSNVLNVASRNCNSNKTKTRRTKTVCLTWPKSCKPKSRHTNNKSKKQKKLLLLTWPNTEKLNKNLRKPRRDPNWLKLKSPPFLSRKKKLRNDYVILSPTPLKILKNINIIYNLAKFSFG